MNDRFPLVPAELISLFPAHPVLFFAEFERQAHYCLTFANGFVKYSTTAGHSNPNKMFAEGPVTNLLWQWMVKHQPKTHETNLYGDRSFLNDHTFRNEWSWVIQEAIQVAGGEVFPPGIYRSRPTWLLNKS